MVGRLPGSNPGQGQRLKKIKHNNMNKAIITITKLLEKNNKIVSIEICKDGLEYREEGSEEWQFQEYINS